MENNEPKDNAPARNIAVMDIQSPATSAPTPTTPSETAVTATPAVVEDPLATEEVTEIPESTATETPTAEAVPSTEAVPTANTPEVPTSENQMAITPANAGPVKHKAPVGAIIAAIIIALVLAGTTIFAYLKTTKTATTDKSVTPVQQPVKAADVQQTSQDVETSLKAIDENKDFANTDLSDTTLGL